MILAALLAGLQPVFPHGPVEAERAFAADAQALGQWTAFSKWAAEDGVLVGRRVIKGREIAGMLEDPEEALRWWPVRSYQSCRGDMAVNIGGWVDPATGKGGQFHTVWRYGSEGWRYLVDIGSRGPDPLPDTGTVEIVTAECGGDPPIILNLPAGEASGISDPEDRSLQWYWVLREDGSKMLRWNYWDGSDMVGHIVEMAAPEPAE